MVDQLKVHSDRLKLLTVNILETSAQERKKISDEIHDTLTHTLTTIHYRLQALNMMLQSNPQSLYKEMKWLNTKVQEAIQQSRKIISVLHPDVIDNIGLNSALENYFEVFSANTRIKVIILTNYDDQKYVEQSILSGAHGFLLKRCRPTRSDCCHQGCCERS